MPYIKQEQRNGFDTELLDLIDRVLDHPQEERDGILNYLISNLVATGINPEFEDWRYKDIARAVAVFECAKMEFYRRVAAPKENVAIEQNGDIGPYEMWPTVTR